MIKIDEADQRQRQALKEELETIGVFRRGSINVFFRKCGKPGCRCNRPGHPGHGPQTTLTSKSGGKTQARNLATPGAVERAREQVKNHDRFRDWLRKWQALNEEMADQELAQAQNETLAEEPSREKKLPRRSKKRSRGKSSV
jgi:hypothetical protein